jgi:hypothetical protein
VSLSVVATGNHYLFDIAAGLAVTALGYAAGCLPLGSRLGFAMRHAPLGSTATRTSARA